jgi:ribonuclease E
VKLDQEVKNTKSVIINVIQPGQMPTAPTESTSESTIAQKVTPEVIATKAPIPKVIEPEQKSLIEEATEPSELTASPTDSLPTKASAANTIADENDANSAATASRRRRRRSSAIEDN